MDNVKDIRGLNPFSSGKWVEVTDAQITADGFKPGRVFYLRVETAGTLKLVGNEMNIRDAVLFPVLEGDNPQICKEIIADSSATASGVWALFLTQ